MYKIGFLGLGKMGSAILNGILKKELYKKDEICFYAPSEETKQKGLNIGINLVKDEQNLFSESSIIILAIKPQKYDEVFSKLHDIDNQNKTIISLAPGKKIEDLKKIFPSAQIVRAMPNTPSVINKGVTTIAYDDKEIQEVNNIFASIGQYVLVKEEEIDKAIPLNGSMPAYIYEFIKTFALKGVSYGLKEEDAYKLTLHTIIGACELVLQSKENIDTLINNVCSKGGSTIEGLNALRNNGFNEAINKCYDACYKRSIELGNK